MSLSTAESIDVHAHVVLEATMGAAGSHGPELTHEEPPTFRVGDYQLHGVRYRGSAFMEVDLRLAAMEPSRNRLSSSVAQSADLLPFCGPPHRPGLLSPSQR